MSEVEGTEELNDENTVKAPAEELVELILTGELHAANQKFNSIIEDKVVKKLIIEENPGVCDLTNATEILKFL